MSYRLRCEWREGEVFSLGERARECGVAEETLRSVILHLRAALGEYRRLPGGLRVDTPRPDVRGEKAFGGFWVWVYEWGGVTVVVKPRVEKYGEMLERVRRLFGDVSWLYLATSGMYAADIRLAIWGEAALLLGELWHLASREPRFLAVRVTGRGGRIGVGPRGVYLYGRRRVRNTALANAVVLGLRRVAEAVQNAEGLVDELPQGVRGVVREYLASVARGVEAVAGEAEFAASWADGEGVGPYWHVAAKAVRGHAATRGGAPGRFVMIPSTKLYELYVYSLFAEALGALHRECGRFCLEAGGVKLYFNAAPLSRLVKKMSRRRPRPDVAVESGKLVAVVEAKYRELSRLDLPDALRLAGYLADVAQNGALKAVVAALALSDKARRSIRASIGNGVEAAVYYAVVNPDGDPADEVRRALDFLRSEP